MKELASGYTFSSGYGVPYHFEHFALKEAKEISEMIEAEVFIVETINWTFAGNKKTVHRNRYYAFGFTEALGIATRIQLDSATVAETVVALFMASDEESDAWMRLNRYYSQPDPEALAQLPPEGDHGKN